MLRGILDSFINRRRSVIKPSTAPPSPSINPSSLPSTIAMAAVRVAIVTGAAQGIGRAIAIRLAEDGMDVAINDLESQRHNLEAVREVILARGRKSLVFTGDMSDEQTVKTMISTVAENLGGVDVMVANAGICRQKTVLETTTEEWDRIFRINARSVFLSYKYAAQQMIAQGRGGRIIGASSGAGKEAVPMLGAYASTKAAIRAITQASALEWGKHGITVNCYAPGAIETNMTRALGEPFGGAHILFDEERKKTACGYIGKPEDVAVLVSYLASLESHFMTGQWIPINGGRQFE
ncbi:hypothetical protein NP233_g2195 [Leucocoprinus birnbaumii]|uniref:Uncharacterized protein n=1 Tax=Leucocoprinus birnbaumii TaxID=56174 RepID=A0AAD5YXF5_9AGAR|nr:hypothetical protein NP233_g2195 [Leucocoprinus birnbaumii]